MIPTFSASFKAMLEYAQDFVSKQSITENWFLGEIPILGMILIKRF